MPPEFKPSALQKYILTKIEKEIIEGDQAVDNMKLEETPDSINYAGVKTYKLFLLLEQAKLTGIPRYNILKTMIAATRENERGIAISMWYNSNAGIPEETLKRICVEFNIDCDF